MTADKFFDRALNWFSIAWLYLDLLFNIKRNRTDMDFLSGVLFIIFLLSNMLHTAFHDKILRKIE